MSVFTEKSFEIFKDKLFVIYPSNAKNFTGVGYDLTIGYFIKIQKKQIVQKGKVIRNPDFTSQVITLETGSSLLVVTHEHAFLSNRVAGTIHIRATYAALGVFMNSTTVDPGWGGQQVFLLFNPSSNDVEINLEEHFCTMVLYDVKHKSSLTPNDTRAVLVKYLQKYQGDTSDVFQYVMERSEERRVFEERVSDVKSLTSRGNFSLSLYFFMDSIVKKRVQITQLILLLALFLLSISILIFRPSFTGYVTQDTVYLVGAIGSFVSPIIAIFEILRHRK